MNGGDGTTQKFGRLLSAVGALGEDLHGQGVIDLEQVRLTIQARRDDARRQVANGKSIRKIAKEHGVNEGTIRHDLGRKKVRKNSAEVRKNSAPRDDHAEERWVLGIKGRALDAADLLVIWEDEFPEWNKYEISDEVIQAAKQARNAWDNIIALLEGTKNNVYRST